jgi:putative colanic acid biosynthesis acetyltransferase WcaF
MSLDILGNRKVTKWTLREKIGRVLWSLVYPAFRFSPRPLWGWRRGMLRLFGGSIGRQAHIHPTVKIAIPWNLTIGEFSAVGDGVRLYNLGRVTIGKRSTVSHGAHLCAGTHDYRQRRFPLLKVPITLGDDVWVCADVFLGPGVRINDSAILAARAVVTRDVPRAVIVAGNPAIQIKSRPDPI